MVLAEFGRMLARLAILLSPNALYRFFSESSMGSYFGVTGGRGYRTEGGSEVSGAGRVLFYGDAENFNDILVPHLIHLRVLDSSHTGCVLPAFVV